MSAKKNKGLKRGSAQYQKHIDNIVQRKDDEEYIMRQLTRQQCMDAACIVLNRKWNFGPKRLAEFHNEWEKVLGEIYSMMIDDMKDDKSMIYSKTKLDEAVLKAVGPENFIPYEERYTPEGCKRI